MKKKNKFGIKKTFFICVLKKTITTHYKSKIEGKKTCLHRFRNEKFAINLLCFFIGAFVKTIYTVLCRMKGIWCVL